MTASAATAAPGWALTHIDPRKFLFSFSSFIAAAATLGIAFSASLPRPWWALLTVYVTAQPMAGAFRPKIFYRLGGVLTGAAVSIAVVPNLQNSPALLVLCMAAWSGLCIYRAVHDRTPRAFLFQMAGFSAAVISFPYLDDPASVFTTTVSRVEEMTVAIICVSITHAVLQPWSATPVIHGKALAFLTHASRWTAEALGTRHTRLEYEHRRQLAADITELGMVAIHLPFDQPNAPATRRRVLEVQQRLGALLPLASAIADRLDRLRAAGSLPLPLQHLVEDVIVWLARPPTAPRAYSQTLVARCHALRPRTGPHSSWDELLAVSACVRLAEFIEAHAAAQAGVLRIGDAGDTRDAGDTDEGAAAGNPAGFALARDHGVAALAGVATAVALMLYCLVWVTLGWPTGGATAAFAALITCSFAAQDDPAPVLARYLGATLVTFPLAALYLFAILPRVDGWEQLVIFLAPALLALGYIQADPQRNPLALPMFSCLIVALGFLDRFIADFAVFINVGLAQVGGILATIAVTRLFRSVSARWTARRIIHDNWAGIARLADRRGAFLPDQWTALATDRLGQVAARMAVAPAADALHAADGLRDLRIGRNVIAIRTALAGTRAGPQAALRRALHQVGTLYHNRQLTGQVRSPPPGLRIAIDRAIHAVLAGLPAGEPSPALLALVGLRCNLLPTAPPCRSTASR